MEQKVMVHYGRDGGRAAALVAEQGGGVLADYGQSLLAHLDDARLGALTAAGLRVRPLEPAAPLRLGAFEVATHLISAGARAALSGAVPLPSGRAHYLLELAGPLHPEWKARLERLGVILHEQLDGGHFLASFGVARADEIESLDFVESVAPYYPALKVNAGLLTPATQEVLARPAGLAALALPAERPAASEAVPEEIRTTPSSPIPEPLAAANLELVLWDEIPLLAAVDAVRALGARVVETRDHSLVVAAAAQLIPALAALPAVRRIDPFAPERLHNNVATGLVHADVLQTTHGLTGAGQIVGMADTGLDVGVNDASMLDDFEGRIVNIFALGRPGDASDPNGHGTHVAGSILGDGSNSNYTIRGVAPAAQLVHQSIMDAGGTLGGIPANLATGLFPPVRDLGARIHTNSWGANAAGAYNTRSTQADTFAFANREFLILFSAGNAGKKTPPDNRVGSPGTAKNVLTVGASESVRALPATVTFPASPSFPTGVAVADLNLQADNAGQVADFSSVGPAQNTRQKPDVVAPGSWILSTRSSVAVYDSGPDGLGAGEIPPVGTGDEDGVATHDEAVGMGLPGQPVFRVGSANTPAPPPGAGPLASSNYMYMTGTSMATPLTAGSCALVRQYLIEQRGHTPSAALIKALVINGAVDMGLGIPHDGQGWGRVDLTNALFPAGTGRAQFDDSLDTAVATGDIRTYDLHVTSAAQPLAITLVWRDPAGAALQNRLHLRLIHVPTATVTTAEPIATIRNNVQKVVLATPPPGHYTVEVEGVSVATGIPELVPALRQDYALVVAGANGFSCNPSDIVQVIDRSGSMGFSGYMEPAKERAKQMIDILQINDKAGVVTFDEAASEPFPLTLVDSQAPKDTARSAIDPITSSGSTDLREALQRGLTTLGPDGGRPRAIVFLSDGFHTVATPPIDDAFLATLAAAQVKVYTIALGPDSDFAVLNQIASLTGTGAVHTVASAADLHHLHEIYYDILGGIGCGGVIHLDSATVAPGATLPPRHVAMARSAREAHFALSWEGSDSAFALRLRSPSGALFDPGSPEVFHVQGSTYQLYRVGTPEPGRWEMLVDRRDARGNLPVSVTTAALADTDVRCTLRLDPKYQIWGKLRLWLKAELAGRPLPGGRAVAHITYPTLSIDDLIRRHAEDLKGIELDRRRLGGDLQINPDRIRLGILADRLAAQGIDLFERRSLSFDLTEAPGSPAGEEGIYTGLFDIHQAGVAGSFHVRVDFASDDPRLGGFTGTSRLPVFVPETPPGLSLKIGSLSLRKGTPRGTYRLEVAVVKADGQGATPDDGVAVEMTLRQGKLLLHSGALEYDRHAGAYARGFLAASPNFLTGPAELQLSWTRNGMPAGVERREVQI